MIKKLAFGLFTGLFVGVASAMAAVTVNGIPFDGDVIYASGITVIENNGVFDKDIYVDGIADVYIKNSGCFTSNVHMSPGARLIQNISGADDAKTIAVNVKYTVNIENAQNVPFNIVSDSAVGADKIIISNSNLIISDVVSLHNVPVEIVGQVNLFVNDVNDIKDNPILGNVIGYGNVSVLVQEADKTYVYKSYVSGGRLFVDVPRETDDNKVFGDSILGDFIEDLRSENSNDNILDDLDSVTDINRVLSKSARFNPEILLRPVHIMYAFDINDNVDTVSGINIKPWGILVSDFDSYGVDIDFVSAVFERLYVNVSGRVGKIEYVNNLDDFSADLYGINIAAKYVLTDSIFMNFRTGTTLTKFDIGNVLYDGNIIHNPDSISGYGVLDFGYKFTNEYGLYMAPIMGVTADYYKVENINKFDCAVRAGIGAGYASELFGVKYNYDINLSAGTNEYLYAGLHATVLSAIDMIGADVNAGIIRMFDMLSYKLSASVKFMF